MPTEETYDEATTATAPIRTWRTWMLSRRPEARAARGAPKGAPWTDLTARRRCFVVGEEKKKESVWRAWPACSLSSCASSRLLVLLSLGMSTKKNAQAFHDAMLFQVALLLPPRASVCARSSLLAATL